jgi:hypothetical protein
MTVGVSELVSYVIVVALTIAPRLPCRRLKRGAHLGGSGS